MVLSSHYVVASPQYKKKQLADLFFLILGFNKKGQSGAPRVFNLQKALCLSDLGLTDDLSPPALKSVTMQMGSGYSEAENTR